MRLLNEQALVGDLERGIGDTTRDGFLFDESLRLRLPVCGLTSYALNHVYQQEGNETELIESSPNLYGEGKASAHVFLSVETEEGKFIVDPTYSQFLDTVGLDPWYVTFGGGDLYPKRKIAVFKYDEGDVIARDLADAAMFFRDNYQEIDEDLDIHPMFDMSYDELFKQFSKIWNPDNFGAYDIETAEVERPGLALAGFILPEHVKLVA